MRPYADVPLDILDLQDIFTMLQNQGEIDVEAILDVALAGDFDDCVVEVKGVGFEEEESSWEPGAVVHAGSLEYLEEQVKKRKLPK